MMGINNYWFILYSGQTNAVFEKSWKIQLEMEDRFRITFGFL